MSARLSPAVAEVVTRWRRVLDADVEGKLVEVTCAPADLRLVMAALDPVRPKRRRGPNRQGCRVTGDICAVHDAPRVCYHGCLRARRHRCTELGTPSPRIRS